MSDGWRRWRGGLVVAFAALAAWWVLRTVDGATLREAGRAIVAAPLATAAVLGVYGIAFLLRALAWCRVVPGLPLGHATAAIHVTLGGNHVLPLRLGEPLRAASVVRRVGVPTATATASTVTLRAADVAALGLLAAVAGPRLVGGAVGRWGWLAGGLAIVAFAVAAAGIVWLRRLSRDAQIRLPGAGVALLTVGAWVLEAVVVWHAAALVNVHLSPVEAVGVTAVTVAAQLLAVAPGGFGTYEAAGTAALTALGVDAPTALAIALVAHALKTGYSLVTGAVALVLPAPGMLGRLRLPRQLRARSTAPPSADTAPVVLFLPAHDEEATVANVIARAPAEVCGRPVRVLVIDDGSTDATAARAAAAGAEVVSLGTNRGLGAAVRVGLAEAVQRSAAAIAFCDADGEYAPEELERLASPVLEGTADYVVGSRFMGRIDRMRPHRRLGNRLLSLVLSFVARRRITDGQSGYRLLSAEAARATVVAHDYNYAQVLTLELLLKGFRYREVPISYGFRSVGRSFVRPVRYLRHVVPAVWRVLNDPAVLAGRGAQSSTM